MTKTKTAAWGLLLAGVAALSLTACNRNEAAQPSRAQDSRAQADGGERLASRDSGGTRADRGSDRGGRYDRGSDSDREARPREPIPDFRGKPMWSDNRRHTAQENAQYHFEHDGADFGAKTLNDYLGKVHDFVENPPAAAETLSRPNGDKLIYDAKTNTFAVVRKDGAPRTAFKPRDGADYWKKQQARTQDEKNGRGSSYRRSGAGDRSGDQG